MLVIWELVGGKENSAYKTPLFFQYYNVIRRYSHWERGSTRLSDLQGLEVGLCRL